MMSCLELPKDAIKYSILESADNEDHIINYNTINSSNSSSEVENGTHLPSADDQDLPINEIAIETNSTISKMSVLCRKIPIGYLYASLSGMLFASTTALSKHLGPEMDPIELAFFRFTGCVLFSIPHAVFAGQQLIFITQPEASTVENVPPPRLSWVVKARVMLTLRGVLAGPSITLTFASLNYLPLAESTVLFFTSTVFTAILARIFLKERFGIFKWLSLVLSLIGVVLVAKLPLEFIHFERGHVSNQLIGSGLALSAAVLSAGVYITARSAKGVHEAVAIFHYASVAMIVLGITAFALKRRWSQLPEGLDLFYLILMICAGFYGQFFITKALRASPAATVAVIRAAVDLGISYIFQVTLFGEIPEVYGLTGTFCVLASLIIMAFS